MTCGLGEGITLKFLRSRIEVEPYDVDIRASERKFAHAQVEVSEEAGEHIQQFRREAEPVVIKFDDTDGYRFYAQEDLITYTENMDGDDRAKLDLKDPRYVLERGEVSFATESTSLRDVINKILQNADDPNDVIEGLSAVDDVTVADLRSELTTEATPGMLATEEGGDVFTRDPTGEVIGNFLDNVYQAIFKRGKLFEDLSDPPNNIFGGFEFNGVTPLQAMQDVMEELEYAWWVSPQGILYVGEPGATPGVLTVEAGDDDVQLSSYTVTSVENLVNAIFVRGPYLPREPDDQKLARHRGLEVWARAEAPGIEGRTEYYAGQKAIPAPGDLETAAARLLIQEIMNNVNGNAKVNGMASSDVERLGSVWPGDYLAVDESIANKCRDDDVTSGAFVITDVVHRANPRRGWSINLDLTKIPNDTIETTSTIYDPHSDQRFEDFEAFKKKAPGLGSQLDP